MKIVVRGPLSATGITGDEPLMAMVRGRSLFFEIRGRVQKDTLEVTGFAPEMFHLMSWKRLCAPHPAADGAPLSLQLPEDWHRWTITAIHPSISKATWRAFAEAIGDEVSRRKIDKTLAKKLVDAWSKVLGDEQFGKYLRSIRSTAPWAKALRTLSVNPISGSHSK